VSLAFYHDIRQVNSFVSQARNKDKNQLVCIT